MIGPGCGSRSRFSLGGSELDYGNLNVMEVVLRVTYCRSVVVSLAPVIVLYMSSDSDDLMIVLGSFRTMLGTDPP